MGLCPFSGDPSVASQPIWPTLATSSFTRWDRFYKQRIKVGTMKRYNLNVSACRWRHQSRAGRRLPQDIPSVAARSAYCHVVISSYETKTSRNNILDVFPFCLEFL